VGNALVTLNTKSANFFPVDTNYSDSMAGALPYFRAQLLCYLLRFPFSENATV